MTRSGSERFNFAYAAEFGRVYKVGSLSVAQGRIDGFEVERRGKDADYPTYVYTAQEGMYDTTSRRWRFQRGELKAKRDLAKLDRATWMRILAEPGRDGIPVDVPANIDGDSDDARREEFAAIVERQFERAYPTTSFAAKLDPEMMISTVPSVRPWLISASLPSCEAG